ncbi:hypothetical protein BS50DRAFT_640969 [Corynespora cassiicola Philippines]|uniref:Ecp2 effector protein domain-containing protein n=1 Tax=Corynespora cassiicola Philippines TaxID=1448308 RepID=A0A2T2N1Y1_CORCC|nr:hypothetical protein BS50DRAFT_640969 [Corynespora cassiicola Philippines]
MRTTFILVSACAFLLHGATATWDDVNAMVAAGNITCNSTVPMDSTDSSIIEDFNSRAAGYVDVTCTLAGAKGVTNFTMPDDPVTWHSVLNEPLTSDSKLYHLCAIAYMALIDKCMKDEQVWGGTIHLENGEHTISHGFVEPVPGDGSEGSKAWCLYRGDDLCEG